MKDKPNFLHRPLLNGYRLGALRYPLAQGLGLVALGLVCGLTTLAIGPVAGGIALAVLVLKSARDIWKNKNSRILTNHLRPTPRKKARALPERLILALNEHLGRLFGKPLPLRLTDNEDTYFQLSSYLGRGNLIEVRRSALAIDFALAAFGGTKGRDPIRAFGEHVAFCMAHEHGHARVPNALRWACRTAERYALIAAGVSLLSFVPGSEVIGMTSPLQILSDSFPALAGAGVVGKALLLGGAVSGYIAVVPLIFGIDQFMSRNGEFFADRQGVLKTGQFRMIGPEMESNRKCAISHASSLFGIPPRDIEKEEENWFSTHPSFRQRADAAFRLMASMPPDLIEKRRQEVYEITQSALLKGMQGKSMVVIRTAKSPCMV